MKNSYSFEADWRPYVFEEERTGFATEERLREVYTPVQLRSGKSLPAGGLPVWSDGKQALLNTGDDHALIYGGTASKKTRTLILPLLGILAQAKESMIVMDIKGELSNGRDFPQIRAALEANGYSCRFLNFREFNGDGFNILSEPYRLYREGQRSEAVRMANDIVDALASIYRGTKADPFWEQTARQFLLSVTILLFELCKDPELVNMLSLSGFCDGESCSSLEQVSKLLDVDNNTMTMLRSVLSEPDRTRMSTLATVQSMMTPFLTNDTLLAMLSQSTFSISELHEKPTALFIILPDEVDTYSSIVGLLLQQISAGLVRDAYTMGGKLPRRVNFVCDEFCNYYVPGMMRSISAHRSRNIRWYLVCQSRKQLQACYPREADTILANCAATYFLSSPELSLMEDLSQRVGVTRVTADGNPRPILSVSDLQSLKKGWEQTDIYYSCGDIHYVGKLPDVDGYGFLPKNAPCSPVPRNQFPPTRSYTPRQMWRDARSLRAAHEARADGRLLDEEKHTLADAYEALFGKK